MQVPIDDIAYMIRMLHSKHNMMATDFNRIDNVQAWLESLHATPAPQPEPPDAAQAKV